MASHGASWSGLTAAEEALAGPKCLSLLRRLWARETLDADARGLVPKLLKKKVVRHPAEEASALAALGARGFWSEALELARVCAERGLAGQQAAGHDWQASLHALRAQSEGADEEGERSRCMTAIGACSLSAEWDVGIRLLHELVFRYPRSPVELRAAAAERNRAIAAFGRGEQWQDALRLLSEALREGGFLPVNVHNTVIKACAKSGQWAWAMQLLQELATRGPEPDVFSLSSALLACGRAGRWQWAAELLEGAAAWGLELDAGACGSAVLACAQGQSWQAALSLFAGMEPARLLPNVIVYTAAASASARAQQADVTFALLDGMRRQRLGVGGETYRAIINAPEEHQQWRWASAVLDYTRRSRLVPDVAVYNAAIAAAARGRDWERSLALLADLRALRLAADAEAYNAACSACRRARRPDVAQALMAEMRRESCAPDAFTYSIAVSSYSSSASWEQAAQMLAEMTSGGLEASAVGFSAAAAVCVQAEQWGEALLLLSAARASSLQPDAPFCRTAAGACNKGREWRAAAQVLDDMLSAGLQLDLLARSTELAASQEALRWRQVLQTLGRMRRDRLEADAVACEAAVQCCEAAGALRPAQRLAAELRARALRPWGPPVPRGSADAAENGEQNAGVLVLALESLAQQTGALDGLARAVLRRSVFAPALSRLRALRSGAASGQASHGRLREPVLERQFGLGPSSCDALRDLSLLGAGAALVELARLQLRRGQVLMQVERPALRLPRTHVAKSIPAWASYGLGERMPPQSRRGRGVWGRTVGHANLGPPDVLAPVFIEHDRSQHAERQALLSLRRSAAGGDEEAALRGAPAGGGAAWLYVCATPCMSCMAVSCQFVAALGGRPLRVAFDTWSEHLRWVLVDLPEEASADGPDRPPAEDKADEPDLLPPPEEPGEKEKERKPAPFVLW